MTALVDQVAARVTAQVPALLSVGSAATLAALIQQNVLPQRTPAAFTLPSGFDAAPNALVSGGHRQDVSDTVGVLLVYRIAGDAKGDKALTALSTIIAAVIAAVAGWEPEAPDGGEAGSAEAFDLVRGRLVDMAAGAVFYQLDFRARWLFRGS